MAHEKVYGICENKCQVEIYDKEYIDKSLCPKNHLSSGKEYGVASNTQYGHARVTSDISTIYAQGGIALAQSVGYSLSNRCNELESETLSLTSRQSTLATRVLNVELSTEDTGWYDLPLADGITSGIIGRGTPQYKKIGNHVFIRGSVNVTALSSGTVLIGTLPEGFRPNASEYSMQPCGGARIAQIFVNSDGQLKLDCVYDLSSGSPYAGELWVQVVIDYHVE